MVNGLAYSGANFNLGFVSLNTFTYCEMSTDHDNQWFVFSNPYATWKVDVITQEVLDGFLLLDGLYYPYSKYKAPVVKIGKHSGFKLRR